MSSNEETHLATRRYPDMQCVYLFMQDYSGSTCGQRYYHHKCRRVFEDFKAASEGHPAILGLWGSNCWETKEEILRDIWNRKMGRDPTNEPALIAKWIKTNIPKDVPIYLWLITDGELTAKEVEESTKENIGINYAEVRFFIFNERSVDISVGIGFIKDRIKIYLNDENELSADLNFDYESFTLENFEEKKEELYAHVGLLSMVNPAQASVEHQELRNLRDRLMDDARSKKDMPDITFTSTEKDHIIQVLKRVPFVEELRDPTFANIDEFFNEILKKIHESHKKSYSYLSLQYQSRENKMANQEETEDVDNGPSDYEYYEPVTLEQTGNSAILLLNETNLIKDVWRAKSFGKFWRLVTCPLFAKEFVDQSVDHVISVESFKMLDVDHLGRKESPFTRNKILGGIVLSEGADAWNDYAIAKTFFGGKKVAPRTATSPTFALWYFMLYISCREKEWIPKLFVQRLKKYAYRRMTDAKLPLALTSLPLDPIVNVPIPFALRFCTDISSYMFGEDPQLFMMERVLEYAKVLPLMKEILQHMKHDVDWEFVDRRLIVLDLVNSIRKLRQRQENEHLSRQDKIRVILGHIFEEEGPFVTTKVKDLTKVRFLDLVNQEFVEEGKAIPLDYLENHVTLNDYVFASYKSAYNDVQLPALNPATWRPEHVIITKNGKRLPFYHGMVETVFSYNNKIKRRTPTKFNKLRMVSMFGLYINFVEDEKRHPTMEEFEKYVLRRKKFVFIKDIVYVRLFSPGIVETIKKVWEMYEEARKSDNVNDFLVRTQPQTRVQHNRILPKNKPSVNHNPILFVNSSKTFSEIVKSQQLIRD